MTKRIVVDPITRIEGHLRMEADIENGVITDAFSTGTMIRGIEIIVKDRDPRDVWAYVGRVCGVCTSIHSLCSVRAVEDALHIVIPPNAEQVRNLMQSAITIQDHVTHFYQLQALDWVDVMSALNADPRKAAEVAQSLSEWPKNSIGYFVEIQKKIRTFIETSKFSIFSNGYWGHPAYRGFGSLSRSARSPKRNRQSPNHFRREKSPPQFLGRGYGLRRQHKRSQRPQHGTVELCRSNH